MSETLTVRSVTFGQGPPKICAPMVGADTEALLRELDEIRQVPFDLLEWRVDFFTAVADTGAVLDALSTVRRAAGEDLPILLTFRTRAEGGNGIDFTPEQYRALVTAAAAGGRADLVDVELRTGGEIIEAVRRAAEKTGAHIVLSHHNFQETPGRGELLAVLGEMLNYDVAISKLAVMPRNRQDVLTLMSAVTEMTETRPDRLNIAISMGTLGIMTRITAELIGSIMTFGAASAASAPGQINTRDLGAALDIIHRTAR